MKKREHLLRLRVAHAVEDGLRLLAGVDEALLAKLGEMLRQRRLPEANPVLELPDRKLSFGRKVTQHEKSAFVSHRLQQTHGFRGLRAKSSKKFLIHATLHKVLLI